MIVANPSPRKARPRIGSKSRPVIADIAFTCPRFSATSTIATGAISAIAVPANTGPVKCGKPNKGAAATPEKSIGFPKPNPLAQIR
jgi:hypothetical protein